MPDKDLTEYFDRDGHAIAQDGYELLHLVRGYRSVAEYVDDNYRISTRWLGKDPRLAVGVCEHTRATI
ncbi:hypothetical protein AB0L82_35695 [Nocardia sp. NPDC052001]|uniref:hypothetical protein n=1 Tax=Nocardia sp. NPDC052001 TaxID=3154853 RepID=UPI003445D532